MFRRSLKENNMAEWHRNPHDKDLLFSTWSDDFETLFQIGSAIYIKAFEGAYGAACKSLFPWVAKYEAKGQNYAESNEFRIQALRLVQTISKVLDKVTDMARLERFLYKLGQRHLAYLPRGLPGMYWDVVQDCVQFGLNDRVNSLPQLTMEERLRAIRIWTDIVQYVFVYVQEGFYDALHNIDRYKSC